MPIENTQTPASLSEEKTEKTRIPPSSSPSSGLADQEVVDLLDEFARALTAGDTDAIVELWETPGLIVMEQMVSPMGSEADIQKMFGGAKEMYAKYGIVDTRADITHLQWIGDKLALVEVRFPWLDAQGSEVNGESSTYTLRRDDEGKLKLRGVVMHGVEKPTGQ